MPYAFSTFTSKASPLEQARGLPMPSREDQLRRDPSVSYFWSRFSGLLESAWVEWGNQKKEELAKLDETIIDSEMRDAVSAAWKDPSKEGAVKDLWNEVAPGVYMAQLLQKEEIHRLAAWMDEAADAEIPTRPPYGIVLNRKGFMLDERSEGYLAIPEFQSFYQTVMSRYMRPIGRLLFQDFASEETDSETFGFSIAWQPGKDENIRAHTDASSYTLNLNINRPDQEFQGSGLVFFDRATGKDYEVHFQPGMAVLHRGASMHASLPIKEGERANLVLWLYGKDGRMSHYPCDKKMTPEERWTEPEKVCNTQEKDRWAPF